MSIRFLDCVLDLDRQELHRDGEEVELEPQVFAVLQYLVQNRERVVPKTELLDEIWGDRFVSESALSSRVSAARRAVGDDGRSQRAIKTVHGRGFRFVAPVEEAPRSNSGHTQPAPDLEQAILDLEAGVGFAFAVIGPVGSGKSEVLESALALGRSLGIPAGGGSFAVPGDQRHQGVLDSLDQLSHLMPELSESLPEQVWGELARCFAGQRPTTRARLALAVRELVLEATERGPVLLVVDNLDYASKDSLQLILLLHTLTQQRRLGLLVAHEPGAQQLGMPEIVVRPTDAPENDVGQVPKALADPLRRLAVGTEYFDVLQMRAATGLDAEDVDNLIQRATSEGLIDQDADKFSFGDDSVRAHLVASVPATAKERFLFETATRLAEYGAPAERIATQYLDAGAPREAAPYALAVAQEALARHAYTEVQAWVEATVAAAPPEVAHALRSLEADALSGAGDMRAPAAYRRVIESSPAQEVPLLRAKLARAALLANDTASAQEALSGLEPDGGPADGFIYLVRGMLAYYLQDIPVAQENADLAAEAALQPGSTVRLVDAITLQGLISHANGEWFDRLQRELRTNAGDEDHLGAFFDAHLCVAEYMLYGPTPYTEVVEMAGTLRTEAERVGALPVRAFAATVSGEASLLAGDLDSARVDLEEAFGLHENLGAFTGTAHTLQRLAELELASGNRSEAQHLARRSLAAGRWSPLAQHLVQRAYGTLIAASRDADEALAAATEADRDLDATSRCPVCDVMAYVPMTMAYADASRLDLAKAALAKAESSAAFYRGSAWAGAINEAKAAIARAEGDVDTATSLLQEALGLFENAGQVLDAERCRETLVELAELAELAE